MNQKGPLPTTVQSAAIRVCRDAFHWRDDLRAVFTTAGVPASLYDKYDIAGNSKAKIARFVFSDLQDGGEPGCMLAHNMAPVRASIVSYADRHAAMPVAIASQVDA